MMLMAAVVKSLADSINSRARVHVRIDLISSEGIFMAIPQFLSSSMLILGLISAHQALAELPPEQMGVAELPAANPHRSYLVDVEFDTMITGRIVVVDPDQKRFLGMISTGFIAPSVLSHDGRVLLSADAFYSRGVRGVRTDVLTAWDTSNLSPLWEVEIPNKRFLGLTQRYSLGISADDRFAYIYNYTPATSVTVVDVQARALIGEIVIPGCILSFPVGARRFASLCGDGSLQVITLDDAGKETARTRTHFFDPDAEKLNERAAHVGDTYYFTTTTGSVRAVDFSGDAPVLLPSWSLTSDAERAAGWAPGGWQLIAVAPKLNRLYALMHDEHAPLKWEDPSTIIWAFDLTSGKKVGTLEAPVPIWSIHATQDDNPLLLGSNIEGGLDIFDLRSGEYRGAMDGLTKSATLIYSH